MLVDKKRVPMSLNICYDAYIGGFIWFGFGRIDGTDRIYIKTCNKDIKFLIKGWIAGTTPLFILIDYLLETEPENFMKWNNDKPVPQDWWAELQRQLQELCLNV